MVQDPIRSYAYRIFRRILWKDQIICYILWIFARFYKNLDVRYQLKPYKVPRWRIVHVHIKRFLSDPMRFLKKETHHDASLGSCLFISDHIWSCFFFLLGNRSSLNSYYCNKINTTKRLWVIFPFHYHPLIRSLSNFIDQYL